MRFSPLLDKEQKDDNTLNDNHTSDEVDIEPGTDLTKEESSLLWSLNSHDNHVEKRHTDQYLQTNLSAEYLQRRLFIVHQEAKSMYEEMGYSPLYLAVSFLEWAESNDAQKKWKAPLILIPVELERLKVGSSFTLHWDEEDISTNISLQAALTSQGIKLPDFDMPETIDGFDTYLTKVSRAVKSQKEWKILNEIHLGFFSFTKFLMYRDLDSSTWPKNQSPGDHPLIKAMFNPSGESSNEGGFNESEIDALLDSHSFHHVEDADPSQIAVIEDVKRGRNLVVEGPPGTGKSQTITNMIGELLAHNKTVLFVSEKMAALEVVKSRLDKDGLGDFCLELHSRMAKKKEFVREIERCFSTKHSNQSLSTSEFDELEELKHELNGYAEALRLPVGKLKISPYSLIFQKEKILRSFDKAGKNQLRVSIPGVEKITQKEYESIKQILRSLASITTLVSPVQSHPWIHCNPGTVLPADEEKLKENIKKCLGLISDLQLVFNELHESTGITVPGALGGIADFLDNLSLITDVEIYEKEVLNNPEWSNNTNRKDDEIVTLIEKIQKEREGRLSLFRKDVINNDISNELKDFETLSKNVFKILNFKYWQLKKFLNGLYREQPKSNDAVLIADLYVLEKYRFLKQQLHILDGSGRQLFGVFWEGENSDVEKLKSIAEWMRRYRKRLNKGIIGTASIDVISNPKNIQNIKDKVQKITATLKEVIRLLVELQGKLGADYEQVFDQTFEQIPFIKLSERLLIWLDAFHQLQLWSQYALAREKCLKTKAAELVPFIDDDTLSGDNIQYCFEATLADELLKVAFVERPALSQFVGELHEDKIKRFMDLDKASISISAKSLRQTLLAQRPVLSHGASSGSQAGILLSEINRKRGHMPIRKLISVAGKLIQTIKPCFMMSPLSIAQFLDPLSVTFDVIVFDEASQVKPEDALGAFLRGKQIVVLGDTRQLPPTNFFDHVVESESSEDFDSIAPVGDIQSILHLCKISFPSRDLRWHYRSKHESLIAVSNQEFYDNHLLLYPSSSKKSELLGLHFVYLPDAVYDRGKSSVNRLEARQIAISAVEHYKKYPDKSLGVGAFNIKQQQAILEEIELQLRQHPEMEDAFKSDHFEHFFVKNLETIQGDERDVIFVSIGFGFDSNGKISLNFGPINQEGGQRRLNVLMTRARERCVIFSNFHASDLSLPENSSWGLKALKVFLEYAETGQLESAGIDPDTESPFEDAVYEFLVGSGVQVRKQIGCAGFRVDLGIINPKEPGAYILGVECDGAKYHMSPVARDRDRLRQQILEKLGWKIYHIWSTDWYRNSAQTKQKLISAIKSAIDSVDIYGESVEAQEQGQNEKSAAEQQFTPPVFTNEPAVQFTDVLSVISSPYQTCSSLGIQPMGELHECSYNTLAEAIKHIVDFESPIHIDEMIRRIRTLWGLGRAGNRIRETLEKSIEVAIRKQYIEKKGTFLWSVSEEQQTPVRYRSDDPPPNIDLICDEEIAEATKAVLKVQYATQLDDLVIQVSRVLGIKATSDRSSARIKKIIRQMIKKAVLIIDQNEMVDIVRA